MLVFSKKFSRKRLKDYVKRQYKYRAEKRLGLFCKYFVKYLRSLID